MRALVLFLLAIAFCPAALAWGVPGHRLVGEVAARHLDPAAQAEVDALLAGEPDPTLSGVAVWADTLRDNDPPRFKQTSSWHYVNTPPGQCAFDPARDCPDGNCVTGAIGKQRAILADRTQPREARRDALKFLVHFVGDVHQPLHAGNRNDRGGNQFQVSLRTAIKPEAYARDKYVDGVMGTNLHAVWDYYVLAERGLTQAQYADDLDAPPWPPLPSSDQPMSPPEAWAAESCRLLDARQLYPQQSKMDRSYPDTMRPLAEQRVRQAAYRLSVLLNETLGNTGK